MKRQNNPNVSKKSTLKRSQRLQHGANWLKTIELTGKQLVHAYSRKFNTDLLCSIGELRMHGVSISVEYEEAVKRSIKDRIAKLQERKVRKQKVCDSGNVISDENFSFIAGYTSGGFPFGLPWDDEKGSIHQAKE